MHRTASSDRDAQSAHDGGADPLDAGPYDGPIRIATAVVAQTYHDFPILPVKQGSKFEVIFNVGPERLKPEHVKSIHVAGPNGYSFDFANVAFTLAAPNGYILNEPIGFFWYQAIFVGFLSDGDYTLTLTLTDGTTSSFKRTLRSNFALLDSYLAHAPEMKYEPSSAAFQLTTPCCAGRPCARSAAPTPTTTSGSRPARASPSIPTRHAATPSSRTPFRPHGWPQRRPLTQRLQEGSAARRTETWHPEIVDSNLLAEISMIIFFPPAQHFDVVP